MSEICNGEVAKVVGDAARTGETLLIPYVAKAIAARCGGSPQLIAEALTQAGILAGVTLQFGTPD